MSTLYGRRGDQREGSECDLLGAGNAVRAPRYWYLATPYSRWSAGTHDAWQQAAKAAGALIAVGVPVYSPIAHTHPIAMIGELDPIDHRIWLAVDAPMMAGAAGLLVLHMPGWDDSVGVRTEIGVFIATGKLIIDVPWPVTPEVAEDIRREVSGEHADSWAAKAGDSAISSGIVTL